jgi:GTP-binding protein
VLFATQPAVAPPRFVLFTTGPLEAAYRRFVERRLREAYGFPGTPIDLAVKSRERRRK